MVGLVLVGIVVQSIGVRLLVLDSVVIISSLEICIAVVAILKTRVKVVSIVLWFSSICILVKAENYQWYNQVMWICIKVM